LPGGNDTLGIASFAEDEQADQITLQGLDASGNEVARLELVHGWFTLTGVFTEDYATSQVDGRKLTVNALGQRLDYRPPASTSSLAACSPPSHGRSLRCCPIHTRSAY
jgi:hypothetical protein